MTSRDLDFFCIVWVRLKNSQAFFYDRKTRPDFLAQLTPFYDVSVSFDLFSKTGMRQFGARIWDCRELTA